MNKPLVIYHGNCPDGFTAAWVTARALRDVELFAAKYGDEPPYETARDRPVYVVDFSYPRNTLERLCQVASALQVLDHHKTAEAELAGLPYCKFDMERSGAGLAWDYFHPQTPRPWIVDYVEDRDLWRFKLPNSETVSLRIRLTPHELSAYDALAVKPLNEIIVEGAGAKLYLDHYVKDALRTFYDIQNLFGDGQTVRCVNVSYTGVSDVLNDALDLHVDYAYCPVGVALAWHVAADGAFNCSLRSKPSVDCSEYAKAYGGGGHAQAAGFKLASSAHPLARRLMRPAAVEAAE